MDPKFPITAANQNQNTANRVFSLIILEKHRYETGLDFPLPFINSNFDSAKHKPTCSDLSLG